jgi:hypothetical protein
MEILGLPAPDELHGKSLLPLIDGRDDGSGRHALGRLVWWTAPSSGPPIARVLIREVFYRGTIKVFRCRMWRTPVLGECPEERAERVREQAKAARDNDLVLCWIDLAQHPDESPEHFSADFSDPRAAAALAEFQRVHGGLLAAPRDCWLMFGGRAAQLTRDIPDYFRIVKERREQFEIDAPGR